jgi:Putative Actinobacterial Holin-X, holin superfamily III
MAEPNGSAQPAVGPEASAGELVKHLSEQVSRLIRDELKLAEYEMTRKAKRMGRGAGMFGGSGLVALYGIGCLLAAAIIGLAMVVPAWAAALIVGGALLVIAGVAALMGKSQVSKAAPPVPEQTVQSVKADVEEVKERAHR